MLNSKKILVSLLVITLLAITFGSVKSLATQPIVANVSTTSSNTNTAGAVTITNTSTSNTANNTANTTTVNNTTGVTNNTTNSAVNKITNTTPHNTTNTTKKSLPYAGSDSTIVFIVLALAVSAAYAYKKVLDYNV